MSDSASVPDSIKCLPWPEQFQALAKHTKAPVLKAFYEAGCVAPDTPVCDVPMVALDFETTGLCGPNCRCIKCQSPSTASPTPISKRLRICQTYLRRYSPA